MASSRVMASSASSANSEITRQSSAYSLTSLGSMNIDDLFRTIDNNGASDSLSRHPSFALAPKPEQWTSDDIDAGASAAAAPAEGEMTLEDFLARAGALTEEEVGAAAAPADVLDRGGRGKKRREMMDPVDKAVMQRQKRMIKNRESAARSRERKQAYTVELESLVTQLEEENAQLRSYQEEQTRKRHKQLLESLIPVTEQRKPLRPLQRSHTM
ncbi:uncharacterized protein M6B38_328445 [Iris pallida]|uniref:BZIP domain-containing protein n=1 Tax=Iris pallida TaxID=29817 RepID=A0AAX6H600_IRIPA|nr:uncharacterized protein M6B38_416825 [Iris pallida]KAJ6836164.1 uncharacterized protein M6B38_328445 [Iris pallida]